MDIRFILTAPPEIATVLEQSVAENIKFDHTLTRKASRDLPQPEFDYLFECDVPRGFFQLGVIVSKIYSEMDRLAIG